MTDELGKTRDGDFVYASGAIGYWGERALEAHLLWAGALAGHVRGDLYRKASASEARDLLHWSRGAGELYESGEAWRAVFCLVKGAIKVRPHPILEALAWIQEYPDGRRTVLRTPSWLADAYTEQDALEDAGRRWLEWHGEEPALSPVAAWAKKMGEEAAKFSDRLTVGLLGGIHKIGFNSSTAEVM